MPIIFKFRFVNIIVYEIYNEFFFWITDDEIPKDLLSTIIYWDEDHLFGSPHTLRISKFEWYK